MTRRTRTADGFPDRAGFGGSRRRLGVEIAIVLLLSIGASAVYSVVSIAYRLTRTEPLSEQTATINRPLSDLEVFDFIYQVLGVFFDLVPVALVVFLLWQPSRPRLGRLGIDLTRPGRDALGGVGLALIIGVPGLGVYLGGKALGWTTTVIPTALDTYWWTVPVLFLAALRAGITEEVIAVGYLFARLRDLGWGTWQIILASAALRGTYHLYQGFGPFIGNFAMGLLFGWLYHRTGRLLPLVIAHVLLDAAIFIGYPWAAATFPDLFGLPS
ncbi:CPBP family intramembrane glutamic endopeptidase [Salinibacterium sp. ZJ454]|uniref:CPBP family intramembrane glutamic endopeptidase n=1 Tax=Salinibacterium sp. ZJ454 TaxID=2708339 RepID=UPI00142039DB|nr:CPBP family intramembrane glutamic endopeptidase [Salinibacterium sp. ZJ454]